MILRTSGISRWRSRLIEMGESDCNCSSSRQRSTALSTAVAVGGIVSSRARQGDDVFISRRLESHGIKPDHETQSAAAIVSALGPADALALKDHIVLRNGQLYLRESSPPSELKSILQKLKDSGDVAVNAGAVPIT